MNRAKSIPLAVVGEGDAPRPRRWSLCHWRALSLVLVHVIILAHIAHWLIRGETLSPVEPSETMQTLKIGYVNAGAIFFAASIALTLVFGRFFCGWGCHFIAYQDLCGWLMRRVGIQPRPLRSRLLALVPLGVALYMFAWPVVYRFWIAWQEPAATRWFPEFRSHLTTTRFWATFPGWIFGLGTVLVAGFAIVYFLGGKGFCTYACPYGAFYGLADKVAPLRVRVSDACDHIGTCTTVCTSNVDVAREVARYGMVVDAGCMKCGDCIRSCPNDALRFGLGPPALLKSKHRKSTPLAASPRLPWSEELILLAAFGVSLFAWRGLYGGFPLLMTVGMSGIIAYLTLTGVRLLKHRDVILTNLHLKSAGRLRPAGWVAGLTIIALAGVTAHASIVQYHRYLGGYSFDRTAISDAVLQPGFDPQRQLSPEVRAQRDVALYHLDACAHWSWFETADLTFRRSWLRLLAGETPEAEALAREALSLRPDWGYLHYHLGRVLKVQGRLDDALAEYRNALRADPDLATARAELGATLILAGHTAEARAHFEQALSQNPDDAGALYYLGVLAVNQGDAERAEDLLRRAIAADGDLADAHYQLGYVLVATGRPAEAVPCFETAIHLQPDMAVAHYNLAVAWFMQRRFQKAKREARQACALNPADRQSRDFLHMLEQQYPE
jgi:tetratricopeptide (TPR) repeat protein/polyferredoxin